MAVSQPMMTFVVDISSGPDLERDTQVRVAVIEGNVPDDFP